MEGAGWVNKYRCIEISLRETLPNGIPLTLVHTVIIVNKQTDVPDFKLYLIKSVQLADEQLCMQ